MGHYLCLINIAILNKSKETKQRGAIKLDFPQFLFLSAIIKSDDTISKQLFAKLLIFSPHVLFGSVYLRRLCPRTF